MMRSTPWFIVGITATVAMLALTPWIWRRRSEERRSGVRGRVFALRWIGVALIPAGLALSGLAAMVGRIAIEVARVVTSFALSFWVWFGLAMLVVAACLLFGAQWIARRAAPEQPAVADKPAAKAVGRSAAPVDDDFADIEALLRKRGIT